MITAFLIPLQIGLFFFGGGTFSPPSPHYFVPKIDIGECDACGQLDFENLDSKLE